MDTTEATQIVMSRVKSFDPEHATKIMGSILIQDEGEKEMIRLAFCPDALLLSYINQAKIGLSISSNTPPANPFSYPTRPENPFPQTSPRIMVPNNGFHFSSSPSSPGPLFPRSRPRSLSYASGSPLSPSLHFHGVSDEFLSNGGVDPLMTQDSPPFHRRSCSVNDAAFLDEGNGGLWRPCMYYARGYCKNGGSCKFLHSDDPIPIDVGSPSQIAAMDELLKLKALQQQRFSFMMSESPRNDFSLSSSSRQIYLTFPADSTFKEDDVSGYFSAFGPVQDVRIPYQQRRMFGFVTFVFPETVKLILAKGNPHYVCDSRVLVKPYKEKGKIREKNRGGEYSGIDSSNDHFGAPFGPRMLLSPRELRLRKLEREVELQHAIELQEQRMMSLQLRDLNRNHQFLQSFPAAMSLHSSPRPSQLLMNQRSFNKEDSEGSDGADENSSAMNNADDFDPNESLDHVLPGNLFASPTNSAAENEPFVSRASADNSTLLTRSSSLTAASLKSCYLQMPRFSSAQEVVEM